MARMSGASAHEPDRSVASQVRRHAPGSFGMAELREAMLDSNGDLIPRPVALHVHLPGRGRCPLCRARWHSPAGTAAEDLSRLLDEVRGVLALPAGDRRLSLVQYVAADGSGATAMATARALAALRRLVAGPGAGRTPELLLLTAPAAGGAEGAPWDIPFALDWRVPVALPAREAEGALRAVIALQPRWVRVRGRHAASLRALAAAAGYLPGRDGVLRRAAPGDRQRPRWPRPGAVDLLPAGPGACGRVGLARWRNATDRRRWADAVDAGRSSASRGLLRAHDAPQHPARLTPMGALTY
jgi:hypothetical protein